MDSLQMSLVVVALVLFVGTQSGFAIRCHVCNSGKDYDGDECWDIKKTGNKFYIPCEDLNERHKTNHTYTMCRKTYQNVEGDKRIIRDCAISGENRCAERTGTRKIRMTYCECFDDGCNTASAIYTSFYTLLGSIITAVLVLRS